MAAVLWVAGGGCAAPTRTRRLSPSVFQSAHLAGPGRPGRPIEALGTTADEGAMLVTRGLHAAGLRFGTDGSTRALWGYMRTSHQLIQVGAARPGDVLFFDMRSREDQPHDCGDHTGVIEKVDPGTGGMMFLEARGGQVRHSYLQPRLPRVRRGAHGEIINTFLRAKKISDPDGTRYFAGDMLCAVARVRLR